MRPPALLEKPSIKRRKEFLAAVRRSRTLHGQWVSAPKTAAEFDVYLRRVRRKTHLAYWVITEHDTLAGAIHISEIVYGSFCSGYLGYFAFVPHHGKGYMTQGLAEVLTDAFEHLGFHRLEANIQPGNKASRVLVQRLEFRLEGFSPRYLKVAGRWRDHERWALTIEDWSLRGPSLIFDR